MKKENKVKEVKVIEENTDNKEKVNIDQKKFKYVRQ